MANTHVICVFSKLHSETLKNTLKTRQSSFSFANFLSYDIFWHALPIIVTFQQHKDKAKETIDALSKTMFCECIDTCGGEEEWEETKTKKMSLGKGEKTICWEHYATSSQS